MKKPTLVLITILLLATGGIISALRTSGEGEFPEGEYGGSIIIPVKSDPASMAPDWQYQIPSLFAQSQIYSKLIGIDHGVAIGGGIIPDLARSWEISSDGLTYTFHLAKDVIWHDGTNFTSADVKYTFDTIIDEKFVGIGYLEGVDKIETPDDYTVKITLKEVDSAFLGGLAIAGNWYFFIVPRHIYAGTDWGTNPHATGEKTPIGTGPFKLKEWVKGSHFTFVANEDYFLGRPYLDNMTFQLMPEATTAQAAFKAGEIPYLPDEYSFTFAEINAMENQTGIRIMAEPWVYDQSIEFNLLREDAPYSDLSVRRAIAYAIDREDVVQRVFYGYWPALNTPGYDGLGEYYNSSATYPEHNRTKAEELLDEAGYPRGSGDMRFHLDFMINTYYTWCLPFAETVKSQLRDVGIDCTIHTADVTTWYSKLRAGDFDITLFWILYGFDPAFAYSVHFQAGGSRNFMSYNNSRVNELIELGRRTVDVQKRKEYYLEVQSIISQEMPNIPILLEAHQEIIKEEWHGSRMDRDYYGYAYNPCWYNFAFMWYEHAEEPEPTYEEWWIYAAIIIIIVVVVAVAVYYRKTRPTK